MASNNTRPADDANQKEQHQSLTPDQVAEVRVRYLPEEQGRDKTPGAFLFTKAEAKYILKASLIAVDAWSGLLLNNYIPPTGVAGSGITAEEYLPRIEQAWKNEGISISRLKRINQKAIGKEYWTYYTGYRFVGDPVTSDTWGEVLNDTEKIIIVRFETKEIHRTFTYDEGEGEGCEFIEASNPVDRAKIAEVPEGKKYLPFTELEALDNIRSFLHELGAFEAPIKDQDGKWAVPNSAITNLFSNIGRANIANVEEGPESFRTGKTSLITSGMGVVVRTIPGEEKLLQNPEADRVFKVFLHRANGEGYKRDTIVMPLKEVQEAIGLSDPKDAKKKIGDAIDVILRSPVTYRGNDADFAGAVLLDSGGVIGQRGRGGNIVFMTFGKTLFNHLRSKRTAVGYIDTNLLKERNQDAYKMGVRIGAHLRNNLTEPNEHRIGVSTLLETSNIPPYESLKDKGQAKQLIIDRFENAMERLIEDRVLEEWYYSYPASMRKGTILTDEDIEKASRDYHFFSRLVIEFRLTNEEVYDRERENKKNQKKQHKKQGNR